MLIDRPLLVMMDPRTLIGAPFNGSNPDSRAFAGRVISPQEGRDLMESWFRLADAYESLCPVYIKPYRPEFNPMTGSVFTANDGVTLMLDGELTYFPSVFAALHRRKEVRYNVPFYTDLGFRVREDVIPEFFEGQADFFRTLDKNGKPFYLYGTGSVEHQWVGAQSGGVSVVQSQKFRSVSQNIPVLEKLVDAPIINVRHATPSRYHVDCWYAEIGGACALIDPTGIAPEDRVEFLERVGARAVFLNGDDSSRMVANATGLRVQGEAVCVLPETASQRLRDELKERGVRILVAGNVEPIRTRTGGAFKCMAFVTERPGSFDDKAAERVRYKNIRAGLVKEILN